MVAGRRDDAGNYAMRPGPVRTAAGPADGRHRVDDDNNVATTTTCPVSVTTFAAATPRLLMTDCEPWSRRPPVRALFTVKFLQNHNPLTFSKIPSTLTWTFTFFLFAHPACVFHEKNVNYCLMSSKL